MRLSIALILSLSFISVIHSVAEEYQGKVGKLAAVFDIEWGGDESVGGTYWYPTRKGVLYELGGEFGADGKIVLREYTNGTVTAVMILSNTGGGDKIRWSGKMKNTDGREFDVWFGE